jgi:hypothetical protein
LLTHSKQYVAQTVSVRVKIRSYKAPNGDLGIEFGTERNAKCGSHGENSG